MCQIPHAGAQIRIDKMKVNFRKNPILAVRLRSGQQELRREQKREEDQKIVNYGEATKEAKV
jgi:hypothetical protein